MALLRASSLRARAQRSVQTRQYTYDSALNEQLKKQEQVTSHDIFLSHSYEDRELILGAALTIQDLGFTVYLDWRDDPQLDRTRVSSKTASKLRERMQKSRSLFYSTTTQAGNSKWMPWELGYMDGHNGRVAILPVSDTWTDDYKGQEYLGIYPYVAHGNNTKGVERLWVHRSESSYVVFDKWLNGDDPYERE